MRQIVSLIHEFCTLFQKLNCFFITLFGHKEEGLVTKIVFGALGVILYYSSSLVSIHNYRVAHHVSDLGWVDLDFGCSTVCLILLGLMRDRQNGQSRWAR